MLKILRDTDSKGKLKNWQKEKKNNLIIAKIYAKNGFKSKAKRISECCDYLRFAKNNKNKLKLKHAYFCHDKLCCICSKRLSMLSDLKLKRIINLIDSNSKYDKCKYVFLTLTCENVKYDRVNSETKKINYAISKMFRRKKLKNNVVGRAKAIEVTYNRKSNDYHIHAHLLLLVNNPLVNGRSRLNKHKWEDLWQQSLNTSYKPDIKVNTLKTVDDARAISNYITKPTDYLKFLINKKIKNKSKAINAIAKCYSYRAKISFSGLFRRANKLIIENRNHSFRKTKVINQDKFNATKYVDYVWDVAQQHHILHYQMYIRHRKKTRSI